jgi:hypothetical protein
MRLLAWLSAPVVVSLLGCAGDSSALMSAWNDGGPGGVTGGSTQPAVGGAGGSGGQVTIPAGSISVPGGVRDLATAQCTSTSGGTCPAPADYLSCLTTKCSGKLTFCYYSDGVSVAAGGKCRAYANCMLACPCNSGRSSCEDSCLLNYGSSDASCSTCLVDLAVCASGAGCILPSTCSSANGGVVGGTGGASGDRI